LFDGGQLTEIPHKQQLDATEGPVKALPHPLADVIQFLQELHGQHRNFINNEQITLSPVLLGPTIPINLPDEIGHTLFAESNAGPRMQGGCIRPKKQSRTPC
jgi:hypothetical protein